MAGRHAHPHAHAGGLNTSPTVLVAVAVVLCAVALAMVWLWPDSKAAVAGAPDTQQVNGVITTMDVEPCPPPTDQLQQSPPAASSVCGSAQVRLTTGDQAGTTFTVPLPTGVGSPTVHVGDKAVLAYSPGNEAGSRYAIIDHERGTQLWVLLVAFVLAVLAFGRWRGLTALLGLGFTFTVILGFVIPAILDSKPPLPVAIVGCSAIVLVVLYLTHGLGRTTTVALAGTLASLLLTGLLSALAVAAMNLSGAGDESSFILGQSHGVDLRGLLLAGILIGSLGVLDDVTVTQAVTVEELARANPELGGRQLYAAATRVGRAHIASVINTIVLAYAGASLPLLVLIVALDDPLGQVLSDQLVATELVRSAVGTIGLIAAVPITTAAAAYVARPRRSAA
ncbi:YibE/F family protein [Phycicoccus sp. Soil803]|uniref:YibE/F family protein n=1 Tax=Phycicoccus sp. Soil803 TaxID=1736415 RepID=UPI000B1F9FB2|nr:YibE/F family protein [Phycicoccus sp. Soil803]